MSRDVTEYDGIKYSLQPHGPKSKLIMAFVFFVVAFGGALLYAAPAQAAPGDCYVETTTPVPNPSASPDPSPSPTIVPTACPTAPPPVTITTTVTITQPAATVTVTKTETKTVYITQNQTVTITASPSKTADPSPSRTASLTPHPTTTPNPPPAKGGGTNLVGWGIGVALGLGILLTVLGLIGFVRNRRQEQPIGRHSVDNAETTLIPVVPAGKDDHDVADYGPDEFDPDLGGHAGDSYPEQPDDTKPMPPVV